MFTQGKVNDGLIRASDVGRNVEEVPPAFFGLEQKKSPMCSLTSTRLNGKPDVLVRQFSNDAPPKDEIKYAQLIALYANASDASAAYDQLKRKATTCPPKQHVPVRRISKHSMLLSHDDTWKTSEDVVAGWTHLRGTETHVEPASVTKYNVYHFLYDYAHLGNAVVVTVYWERSDPKVSADPIYARATKILTHQLQRFG
ncbi:hypothetical protein BTM25_36710 [Actinomadura rubteroloni]|uniref:Uncharacterized protein n=1 Tax=Actinomadura rubteroloni TaxID=1926885 RepID=A0A2P4UJ26_9ACTN|nr:hypothetical protein BTM25_36710 [Actinomadura rubteroloni]